jgi:hypothetical protein
MCEVVVCSGCGFLFSEQVRLFCKVTLHMEVAA